MKSYPSSYPVELFFLRHAKAEHRYADFSSPLSEVGKEEASLLKERLLPYPMDLVFVSPALRAKQTQELCLEGVETIEVPSLYRLLNLAGVLMYGWEEGKRHPLLQEAYDAIEKGIQLKKVARAAIIAHSGVLNLLGALFCKEHAKEILALSIANADGFFLKTHS